VERSRAAKGRELFDEDCSDCHEIEGTEAGDAPNLAGRGSLDMLAAFIADSGKPQFFGKLDEMPAFGRDKLSEDERYLLAEYLMSLRDAAPRAESR